MFTVVSIKHGSVTALGSFPWNTGIVMRPDDVTETGSLLSKTFMEEEN